MIPCLLISEMYILRPPFVSRPTNEPPPPAGGHCQGVCLPRYQPQGACDMSMHAWSCEGFKHVLTMSPVAAV